MLGFPPKLVQPACCALPFASRRSALFPCRGFESHTQPPQTRGWHGSAAHAAAQGPHHTTVWCPAPPPQSSPPLKECDGLSLQPASHSVYLLHENSLKRKCHCNHRENDKYKNKQKAKQCLQKAPLFQCSCANPNKKRMRREGTSLHQFCVHCHPC